MSKLKVNNIESTNLNPISIKGDLVVSGSVTVNEIKIGPDPIIGPINGSCIGNINLKKITGCGKSNDIICYSGSNNTLNISQNLIIGRDNKNIADYVFAQGFSNKIVSDFSHAEGSGNTVGTIAFLGQILNGNIYLNSSYGNVITSFLNSTEVIISDTHSNNIYGTLSEKINTSIGTNGLTYNNVSTIIHLYNKSLNSTNILIIGSKNLLPCSDLKSNQKYTIGHYSHVEGRENFVFGNHSHAEGRYSISIGDTSHAEGIGTSSRGAGSHTEGSGTTSYSLGSHAEGGITKAYGEFSHAEGYNTKAGMRFYQTTSYTASTNTVIFAIDNSIYPLAYQVFTSPVSGIVGRFSTFFPDGFLYDTIISVINVGSFTHITVKNNNRPPGQYPTIGGSIYITPFHNFSWNRIFWKYPEDSSLILGSNTHAEGNGTITYGGDSHAEGSETRAIGANSHSEGTRSVAVGNSSHSEGYQTKSHGEISHAEGYGTIADGDSSHAEGSFTIASGYISHSEGDTTISKGEASHAEGYFTSTYEGYSHTEGGLTITNGTYSHAEGFRSTVGLNKLVETISFGGTPATLYVTGNVVTSITSMTMYPKIIFDTANAMFNEGTVLGITYNSTSNQTEIIIGGIGGGLFPEPTSYTDLLLGETITGGIYITSIDAVGAHAEGFNTSALGYYSHSEGNNTIADQNFQHVLGVWNLTSPDALLIVGNGTSTNRSNRFEVNYDDVNVYELLKIVNIPTFSGNTAAIAGGLSIGHVYRNGDDLKIVH